MSFASQLQAIHDGFNAQAPPEVSQILESAITDFKTSYDPSTAIQVGQKLPEFSLFDANGKQVSSSSFLTKGPLILTFYRGEWCPYCNLDLREWQKFLPELQAQGATFVAVSPQLPDASLSTVCLHYLLLGRTLLIDC